MVVKDVAKTWAIGWLEHQVSVASRQEALNDYWAYHSSIGIYSQLIYHFICRKIIYTIHVIISLSLWRLHRARHMVFLEFSYFRLQLGFMFLRGCDD